MTMANSMSYLSKDNFNSSGSHGKIARNADYRRARRVDNLWAIRGVVVIANQKHTHMQIKNFSLCKFAENVNFEIEKKGASISNVNLNLFNSRISPIVY